MWLIRIERLHIMSPIIIRYRFQLAIAGLILLGVICLLPALNVGLLADDYWHAVWVSGTEVNPSQAPLSPYGLFAFFDGDSATRTQLVGQGALPWWAAQDFSVKFWRPLTEVFHVDYQFFADQAWLLHLHSILWFAGLLILLAAFYQRVLSDQPRVILLALLFFIAEPFHAISVSWIANRNLLVAAVFVLASLIQFIDYRQKGKICHQVASLVLLLLALFSAEISVSIAGFLLAYVIFIDQGKAKIQSILPHAVIILLWLISYKLLGYGSGGAAVMYVDPVAEPLAFLAQYIERVPTVVALQIAIFPKLLSLDIAAIVLPLVGAGFILIAVYAYTKYKNPLIGFSLLTIFVSVVPLASALLHERNFVFISISTALLLAIVVDYLWKKTGKISRTLMVLILSIRGFITLLLVPLACIYLTNVSASMSKSIRSLQNEALQTKHVITLGMPIMHSSFVYPYQQYHGVHSALSTVNLFSELSTVKFTRVTNNSWSVSAENGLFSGDDLFLRDIKREPFKANEQLNIGELHITIDGVNQEGNVTALHVQVEQSAVEDYLFYSWSRNQLSPLSLEVGESFLFNSAD